MTTFRKRHSAIRKLNRIHGTIHCTRVSCAARAITHMDCKRMNRLLHFLGGERKSRKSLTSICRKSEVLPTLFINLGMSRRTGLLLHRYAFLKDPGKHTERSVRREGYWHFDARVASSPPAAVTLLKDLMRSLETLAFGRDTSHGFPEALLIRVVAWEERMALAIRKSWPESATEKPSEQGAFPDSIEYQTSLFQLSSARRL